jgi:hypothetical protein
LAAGGQLRRRRGRPAAAIAFDVATHPVELLVDVWNDRGMADRTAIQPEGTELAIAAIRCGALVAHRRTTDHVLQLTRWSGE